MDNLNFHARAIIVFSISIAITLFSLYFIGDAQRVRSIEQFEISAQRHTRLLQSMIDKDIDAIESTAIFFRPPIHMSGITLPSLPSTWSEKPMH